LGWPRTRFTSKTCYRKQFKIPEAHHQFIEQTLEEGLKLGVVRRSDLLYNSPIFCVPKKQGQGLQIVQDFCELNQNSHIDKCEGNHGMHQGHRPGQLQNLFHLGSHFQILADETG
jgi:hypothetical protein